MPKKREPPSMAAAWRIPEALKEPGNLRFGRQHFFATSSQIRCDASFENLLKDKPRPKKGFVPHLAFLGTFLKYDLREYILD